jgi:transcription factor E
MCQLIEQGVTTIADLAETMSMPRRATRQVLYQMNKVRAIGYKRVKKDRRIVFHWFITPKKIKRMITTARRKQIREIEERIEFEQDHKFFECRPCNERYLFSEAYDFDFMCEHCGGMLEAHENVELIEKLRGKLSNLIEEEKLSEMDIDEEPELEEDIPDAVPEPPPDPPKRKSKKKKKEKKEDEEEDGVYYDSDGWPDEKKILYYGSDEVPDDDT